jgi:hypothetical protein
MTTPLAHFPDHPTRSLTMAVQVPLSVLAFTLPLPLLAPAELGATFWAGCGVLMAGLALYNGKGGGGGAGKEKGG